MDEDENDQTDTSDVECSEIELPSVRDDASVQIMSSTASTIEVATETLPSSDEDELEVLFVKAPTPPIEVEPPQSDSDEVQFLRTYTPQPLYYEEREVAFVPKKCTCKEHDRPVPPGNSGDVSFDSYNEEGVSNEKEQNEDITDTYEVESILEHRVKFEKIASRRRRYHTLWFFIKWVGWDDSWNEWKAEADMHCEDLIMKYFYGLPDKSEFNLRSLLHECSYGVSIEMPIVGPHEDYRHRILKDISTELESYPSCKLVEDEKARDFCLVNMQSYLSRIYDTELTIQNHVDTAILPDVCTFLRFFEPMLYEDDKPMVFEVKQDPDVYYMELNTRYKCFCYGECGRDCVCVSFASRNANDDGEALMSYSICGEECGCRGKCLNRRDQVIPPKMSPLQISRFEEKYWVLASPSDLTIDPGFFICEVFGKIAPASDGQMLFDRAMKYGFEASIMKTHYFTDGDGSTQMVDLTVKGSLARFVQHSCVPNATVVRILHPTKPTRLYLVALRQIRPSTHITVNMFPTRKMNYLYGQEIATRSISSRHPSVRCLCERKACKKELFKLNGDFFRT